MRAELLVIWVTFCRTWLKIFRRPVILVFSFAQPLMWMLFFGFLFQSHPLDGAPGLAYVDFLLPGICAMTVLFGASQSGTSLIRDMQTHFWDRLRTTPASIISILLGKIFADVSRILGQALLIAIMGVLIGAKLHVNVSLLLPAVGALALFGFIYCSLSCAIALKTRSQEMMGAFIQIVNMPILFTSTALVPQKQMPLWLGHIAHYNPLSLVADMCRRTLLGLN